MTNNNSDVLHVDENGVEIFTVVATGESGMSQRGLAKACGKRPSTIQNLVENLVDGKAPEGLERFVGKKITLTPQYKKKGGSVIIYTSDFCSAVIRHYARLSSKGKKRKTDNKSVYVIWDEPRNVCKIGIAANVEHRLKGIQTGYPFLLSVYFCKPVKNALVKERWLHKALDDYRLYGEWFDAGCLPFVDWSTL